MLCTRFKGIEGFVVVALYLSKAFIVATLSLFRTCSRVTRNNYNYTYVHVCVCMYSGEGVCSRLVLKKSEYFYKSVRITSVSVKKI